MIELDNLIVSLFRHFLVSSLLNARTRSGVRVKHSIAPMTQVECALFIMRILAPNKFANSFSAAITVSMRDEVKSRDPAQLLQVANAAGLTNTPSIINAMSLNTTAFSEISRVRHFFAHRNEETASRAVGVAASKGIVVPEAWQCVDFNLPGKPYTLLEGWVAEIEPFVELLLD